MALTQVRVKLEGVWTVLTYNSATGRYEGTLTAPGTSINQPGGYYNLEADCTNSNGQTASISGTQLPSLRMVVRETAAPTLTLVSPPAGWLTTSAPTFVFRAQDEAGGSGIDTSSVQATVDGRSVACTLTQDGDGYRLTFSASGLSEGQHTVSVAISDRDGNQTSASAAYTVDTIPPELRVDQPRLRHVVDDDTVTIQGEARDSASAVTVTVGDQRVEVAEGRFAITVPLEVGENTIAVVARDAAGWTAQESVYMIRLITDRTPADRERLLELVQRPVWEWTAQELTWYNQAVHRGVYNAEDRNRVGAAVRYLTQELAARGYDTLATSPKTDWTEKDAPTAPQMETYLSNVAKIRAPQGLEMPEIPDTMRHLTPEGANQLEKVLVEVDAVFPMYSVWTAGEITAGEF